MTADVSWRLIQIADSAFPTGGFAHSAGLEAATHFGEVDTPERLESYLRMHLWNVGNASLPFVAAAHDRPSDVWTIDRQVDAFLLNHVANRASRTQGRAFVATCASVFVESGVQLLARRSRVRDVACHLAPIFGAALTALGIGRRDTLALYLYLALRGVASAAVRLGIVGPHEAQRLLRRHADTIDAVVACCAALLPDDVATTAPLIDLLGATHDRLYARLFQS
jgi:urease accessory protein